MNNFFYDSIFRCTEVEQFNQEEEMIESAKEENKNEESLSITLQLSEDSGSGIPAKKKRSAELGTYVDSSFSKGITDCGGRRCIADRLARNQMDAMHQQLSESPRGYDRRELTSNPKCIVKDKKCIMIRGELGRINQKLIGIASSIGFRQEMEDNEIVSEGMFLVQEKLYSFDLFGIFDGHQGKNASSYVKMNIKQYLIEALENDNQEELTDEGVFAALKKCFIKLDEDYEGIDGTTATIALVLEGKIWVANVGDSRIILIDKQGKTIQATEDAKPNMAAYIKKIQKLGGEIQSIQGIWRINGILAVARAIGDKTIKGSGGLCCVSPSPKITCFSLADFDRGRLVLACDGLYDVASTNEVGQAVHSMAGHYSPENISRKLVYRAIKNGSQDNVSVMVVEL